MKLIHIVNNDDRVVDADKFRIWRVYSPMRLGFKRLAKITRFRNWECIMFGATTGIEIDVGKLHFELLHRSRNA